MNGYQQPQGGIQVKDFTIRYYDGGILRCITLEKNVLTYYNVKTPSTYPGETKDFYKQTKIKLSPEQASQMYAFIGSLNYQALVSGEQYPADDIGCNSFICTAVGGGQFVYQTKGMPVPEFGKIATAFAPMCAFKALEPVNSYANNNTYQPAKKKKSALPVIIIIIVLLLAAAAALSYFFLFAPDKDGKGDESTADVVRDTEEDTSYEREAELETDKENEEDNDFIFELPTDELETEEEIELVTVYTSDGEEIEIAAELIDEYLDNGYYKEPVKTIYSKTMEIKVVPESEIEEWLDNAEEGWSLEKYVMLYAKDGRERPTLESEVEAYLNVGWYEEKYVTLYALDAHGYLKTGSFKESDVEAQLTVGWHLNPRCDYCWSWDHVNNEHPFCAKCGSAYHSTYNHPEPKPVAPTVTEPKPVAPTVKCDICASTAHNTTGHPKCSHCGSTAHTSANHPVCNICKSTAHSTDDHPMCTICNTYDHTTDSNKHYEFSDWVAKGRVPDAAFDNPDKYIVQSKTVYSTKKKEYTQSYNSTMKDWTMYKTEEKDNGTLYFFYKWSGWSGYSDTVATENDETQVRTELRYRYAIK